MVIKECIREEVPFSRSKMSSFAHYPVRFFLVFLVVWVAPPASEGMSFTFSIIFLEYFYLSPVKSF